MIDKNVKTQIIDAARQYINDNNLSQDASPTTFEK